MATTQGPDSLAQRRRTSDERFLDEFQRLTGFPLAHAYPDCLPRAFLDTSAPSPGELLTRFGRILEPRTSNALRRHVAGRVDQGAWTFRRLLQIRGFGLFSLLDTLHALFDQPQPQSQPAQTETTA